MRRGPLTRILAAGLAVAFAMPAVPAAPLKVVALGTVLTEVARCVGGRDAVVIGLVKPGIDPHTFEPAPDDVRRVADADLIFACGLGMEPYLDKLVANSGTRGRVVRVGRIFDGSVPTLEQYGLREPDPHWWNSIAATEAVTRKVGSEYAGLRPSAAAGFEARTQAYLRGLAELDAWTRRTLAVLPPGRRILVTSHDAFGWFARDYGFRIIYLSGLSPEAEPDARTFAATIDAIRNAGVPTLFVENTANPRLVEAAARETGARIGGELYGDGLVPGPQGDTYAAMFRHNVRAIVAGLR